MATSSSSTPSQQPPPQQQRHPCPVCGSTFTRSQHVVRHLRSHTGERPYKCKECGDSFARSDLLSRHVNKCHPDVPPHSAGVPTKSSSKRKPCDQCVQNRTKCDTSIPCGKCVYHNLACSRVPDSLGRANGSVGGPSYVPSSIPSSPYYNHRGATTSAASLPDLSSEGHYHHYRSRRLSDAGSASSRASYSTSGSVGNLGFDSGLQLSETEPNIFNTLVPDLPSLHPPPYTGSGGPITHSSSPHHERSSSSSSLPFVDPISSFPPQHQQGGGGFADPLPYALTVRDYAPRPSSSLTDPATTNVSHQSGYNVTDATPLASHQSRNPLETYAAVAAATAASAPSNHPYANLLNQPGGVVSPANSGGGKRIDAMSCLTSSPWFAASYGHQQQQPSPVTNTSLPGISSLDDGTTRDHSTSYAGGGSGGALGGHSLPPPPPPRPLYAYGSRDGTNTATSVSSSTRSGASSDYEYDGGFGGEGGDEGGSSKRSGYGLYSNSGANQSAGSLGGGGDGLSGHGVGGMSSYAQPHHHQQQQQQHQLPAMRFVDSGGHGHGHGHHQNLSSSSSSSQSSASALEGTGGRIGGGMMVDSNSRELPIPSGMGMGVGIWVPPPSGRMAATSGTGFPPLIAAKNSSSQLPSLNALTSSAPSAEDSATSASSAGHHSGAGTNNSDEEKESQRRLKDLWANWMTVPMDSTVSEKEAFIGGGTPGAGGSGSGGAGNVLKTPAPGSASASMFQQFFGGSTPNAGQTPGAGMGSLLGSGWVGGGAGGGSNGLGRVMSMPSIRTPTNETGRRVGHAGAGGDSLITPQAHGNNAVDGSSSKPMAGNHTDDLRKYQEACLAREPLALRLQPPARTLLRKSIVPHSLNTVGSGRESRSGSGSGSGGHGSLNSPDSSNAGSPGGETNVSNAPTPASTYSTSSPHPPFRSTSVTDVSTSVSDAAAGRSSSLSPSSANAISALSATAPPGPLAKSNLTGQIGDPRPSYKRLASHTLTQDTSKRATLLRGGEGGQGNTSSGAGAGTGASVPGYGVPSNTRGTGARSAGTAICNVGVGMGMGMGMGMGIGMGLPGMSMEGLGGDGRAVYNGDDDEEDRREVGGRVPRRLGGVGVGNWRARSLSTPSNIQRPSVNGMMGYHGEAYQ